MSVQLDLCKNVYRGDGSTRVFPYTFEMNENHPEYIVCYKTDGNGRTIETGDFSVDVADKKVTFPLTGDPLREGELLTIYRKLPLHQPTELPNQGAFFAEVIERSLDDIVFMLQQFAEAAGRSLKFDVSTAGETAPELPPPLAGMAMVWNEDGTKFVYLDVNQAAQDAANAAMAENMQEASSLLSETQAAASVADSARRVIEEIATNINALVVGGTAGNLVVADADGKLADSGVAASAISANATAIAEARAAVGNLQDNGGYSQITKLNIAQMRTLEIPTTEDASFVRPPVEVLKLRDDGISETVTACSFNNGDKSDFSDNGFVAFSGGTMHPKTRYEIPMSVPAAFGVGHMSSTVPIDPAIYKTITGVDVA